MPTSWQANNWRFRRLVMKVAASQFSGNHLSSQARSGEILSYVLLEKEEAIPRKSYTSTGQFEDADGSIERRIQDELRARQAASARVTGALGRSAGFNDRSFMSSLIAESAAAAAAGQAASPFYAASGHQSPFARPYSALNAQSASPYVRQGDAVASLYARQRYGYGAAAAAGVPPYAGHELYSPHFARSPQELSLIDRYNAQQREAMQNATANKSPTTTTSASYLQKGSPQITPSPKASPRTPQSSATPKSDDSTPASQPRPVKSSPAASRPSSSEKTKKIVTTKDGQVLEEPKKWFAGCVPLGLEDDKYWLSELQVYLRANFAEAFGATEDDIAAPMHGRNKPIALGQVGIRCMHCKHENPSERGQQATSYPSLISGIYNSVQQMLRLHMDCCQAMPPEVRAKIDTLKLSSSSRGGRKQYWIDSAKRLGLVDTLHGIHFGRDPHGPLPPLTGPSVHSKEGRKKKEAQRKANGGGPTEFELKGGPYGPPIPQLDERPLVFAEDKPLISDYLYLTLEQMSPCVLMEADRVGCYKTRKVGFPGLACKHCVGQAGCGRYFPASEASLSQTTTSQTIMNHVRNCRRCPIEIRENLEIMKRARMGPDGKRADKPKHGGRKVFFHRLWCRIQGVPMEEGKGETREKKKRGKKAGATKKLSRKRNSSVATDSEGEDSDSGEKAESIPKLTESSEETESETESEESENGKKPKSKGKSKASDKKASNRWYEGCVRLTKSDDPHWLSELQCFARSDLIEVFSWKEKDGSEGYSGRKEPAVGQVAIRCVFCKTSKPEERPSGCLVFPDSLSSIHSKVGDMLRLHFPSCTAMPDDTKETFRSLRGFGPKVADDSQQYWIDAARDIGLANVPPGGPGVGWGITFRRNPLPPSPSDELDRETAGATTPTLSKMILVRPDDQGSCTDQVMLLMRQVKACTFEKRDRRGGPGARGRDRVIGFPGLCCKHCASKNNIGRYFPVSAKNLTDNTANSILSHISGCSRCPESIKASLVFLSHRAIIQKAELSGSWKKAFFKKIWDRLHVERAWSGADEEDAEEEGSASLSSEAEETDEEPPEVNASSMSTDSEEEEEEEQMGDSMATLIKAAAIWLTEQDHINDGNSSRNRTSRGRTLPGNKRSSPMSSRGKNRSGSLTSGKRRRVHF
eukprot:scaffold8529_cov137-Cylindrotheca_fusiformis.AAC.11